MKAQVSPKRCLKRALSADFEAARPHSPARRPSVRPKSRYKKAHQQAIYGQKLSLARALETLDKAGLRTLVASILNAHPELSQEVSQMAPKVSQDRAISLLQAKVRQIAEAMPYKVDPASDYCFLRVKQLVVEFFQALSDYTLSYLPPEECDSAAAFEFVTRFLTQVFPQLPPFEAIEYKYYYKLTVDKFNTILCDAVASFVADKKQNIFVVLQGKWLERLQEINKLNAGLFEQAETALRREVHEYESSPVDGSTGGAELQGLNLQGSPEPFMLRGTESLAS